MMVIHIVVGFISGLAVGYSFNDESRTQGFIAFAVALVNIALIGN
jgi:predicted permease